MTRLTGTNILSPDMLLLLFCRGLSFRACCKAGNEVRLKPVTSAIRLAHVESTTDVALPSKKVYTINYRYVACTTTRRAKSQSE